MHAIQTYNVRGALTIDMNLSAGWEWSLYRHVCFTPEETSWSIEKEARWAPEGNMSLIWNLPSPKLLNQLRLHTNQFGSSAQWRTRIIPKTCYNCCFISALKIPKPRYYSGRNYLKNHALRCKTRRFTDALNAHSGVCMNIYSVSSNIVNNHEQILCN
jgi:hypothetical protein